MPVEKTVMEIADKQGWDEKTVLGLALVFIEMTNSVGFIDYIEVIAKQENLVEEEEENAKG